MPRDFRLAAAPLFVCAALCTGCQVLVASITSPSDWVSGTGRSISGSFEGLSTSSGSGGGVAQAPDPYRDDVRVYTAALLRRGPDEAALSRELGRIALRHGISHWEGHPSTFRGLGAGVRGAGLGEAELGELLARLGREGPRERELALEGFRAASP
jgi:hypothetical protein